MSNLLSLTERIYEAGAFPENWPAVLQAIADRCGAAGATIVFQDPGGIAIVPSPRIAQVVSEYIAEGWAADPTYPAPLLEDQFPGFRAETHYRSIDEIEQLPVHRQFLKPRGFFASVGTVLQGARDDAVHMALEGLQSHRAAEAVVPFLDTLRPALGRALSLTARLRTQADEEAVTALDLAGVPAAVVDPGGLLRAANQRFERRFGSTVSTRDGRVRFADHFLQDQLTVGLASLSSGTAARTVAVGRYQGTFPFAVHLMPLRRAARDVFGSDGVLMIVAEPSNASLPSADLLRLMFDLTPAESRVARHLVGGGTVAQAKDSLNITSMTMRTHLKSIFLKVGVTRQADMVRLLEAIAKPAF